MSTSLCSAVTYSTGLGECREGEREDISCIISCSSKRCLSDLVHDMPPCFSVSSSLALLYMIPSLCLPVFPHRCSLYLSACSLPVSLHVYLSSPTIHPRPAAGSRGGTFAGPRRVYLLPPHLLSGRQARCRLSLYTHF